MKTKYIILLVSLILICVICTIPVCAAPQGTNGDELQVLVPSQLEIQLGTDWSGVEFQMRTDSGVYPNNILVGSDGILRLEIGGSSKYVLSCLNSSVPVPEPDDCIGSSDPTQAPTTNESNTNSSEDISNSNDESNNTVAGIPITHLLFFVIGMILAIGTLIMLHMNKKNREKMKNNDADEDE